MAYLVPLEVVYPCSVVWLYYWCSHACFLIFHPQPAHPADGQCRTTLGDEKVHLRQVAFGIARCGTVNKVEAVVRVTPGTAVTEHVARLSGFADMTTEAIHVAAVSALGVVIIVIVGIAVDDEVVRTFGLIDNIQAVRENKSLFIAL